MTEEIFYYREKLLSRQINPLVFATKEDIECPIACLLSGKHYQGTRKHVQKIRG